MRVDNRVNQPPPARHRDNEATSHSAKPWSQPYSS
jgi:hypothetical protein